MSSRQIQVISLSRNLFGTVRRRSSTSLDPESEHGHLFDQSIEFDPDILEMSSIIMMTDPHRVDARNPARLTANQPLIIVGEIPLACISTKSKGNKKAGVIAGFEHLRLLPLYLSSSEGRQALTRRCRLPAPVRTKLHVDPTCIASTDGTFTHPQILRETARLSFRQTTYFVGNRFVLTPAAAGHRNLILFL